MTTAVLNTKISEVENKIPNTSNLVTTTAKIKVDSYDSLPIPYLKRSTLHSAIIHIKSVLNKDKNNCYYKIFLEKCSYQLAKK